MASGKVRLHPAEQILVPADRQLRVQATLKQDLHAAQVDRLLELLGQLLARQHVAVGLVRGWPVEVAELAAGHADVRVVDVAVDDVGDLAVGVQGLPAGVGGGAQLQRRRFGVEAKPVVRRQTLPGGGVGEQSIDGPRRRADRRRRDARAGLEQPRANRPREQLGGAGPVEERRQPRELLGAELMADVVPEVALVVGRVAAVRLGPGARDHGPRRQPLRQALLQQGDVVRADGAGPPGQDRVDERQARQLAPGGAEIERVGEARGGAEAGVADHERAGGPRRGVQHLVVRHLAEARRQAAFLAQQAQQHRRAAGRAVEGDRLALRQRDVTDQQHGAHRAEARDRDPGDDAQLARSGRVAGARDQAQVDLAALQQLGAARRQLERQLEAIVAQAVLEAVGDRPGVQERDGGELLLRGIHDTTSRPRRTSRRNGLSDASAAPSATTLYSVSRSTGVRPALRMMRMISAGLITCGVSAPAM